MSLMSSLFGKKPKYVNRGPAEQRMLDTAQTSLADAKGNVPLMRAYMDTLKDTSGAESRARGTANADVMQTQVDTPYDPNRAAVSPGMQALSRGRALARIGFAGAQSAKDDAFRAKMAAVQFGKQVRSGASGDAVMADLEYRRVALRNELNAQKGGLIANLTGTLAGAGAAAYQGQQKPAAATGGGYEDIGNGLFRTQGGYTVNLPVSN